MGEIMKIDCNMIRREIDEANLDDRLTIEANEHLSRCDQCRRFRDDRRTLRGLMAELETVGAPADFDFRLRARLARERPSNGFGSLLLTARPIAAVALVVLIGGLVVVVKNRMSPADNQPVANKTAPRQGDSNPVPPPGSTGTVPGSREDSPKDVVTVGVVGFKRNAVSSQGEGGVRNIVAKKAANTAAGNTHRPGTRDSAGGGAPVITQDPFAGLVVVPVDARTFRLSINNGRGGARTIFLPPVSFGSQRLLTREASFVPVSSAKGDW